MSNIEPRQDMVDGEQKYTYDPWENVDDDVREEQDNDYIAEMMAEIYDQEDDDLG